MAENFGNIKRLFVKKKTAELQVCCKNHFLTNYQVSAKRNSFAKTAFSCNQSVEEA